MELATLAPERVTVLSALADALPGLERRAAEAEAALAAAGADSVFRALAARAAPGLPGGGEDEASYLERALAEVRGQLLDGRDPGRYAWLATDDLEYEVTALVADTAHRLSALPPAPARAGAATSSQRGGELARRPGRRPAAAPR